MNNSTPPSTDAVPTESTLIGHYALLDCIGRGGMGLVYRARDTKLDRQVAIKCLRTELFEAHYVERFKREALLLAKLNHPNIVQIYDFIEAPEQVALVMELVDGQNLQLHLREHIVTFAQRMRWLAEIAQGLAVAHDTGIIHRDLKAENILINQRKVAKITDLGIAKSQDFNSTLTDHVAGSYCSMSPEQAMGEPLDFKSDLFSFGILAYQLLCGSHPFGDTNNKLQLMQRIISHPPIAPSKHNPDLPPEINDLLGQLLSKDPDKRPNNTHWVAAQLEKLSHLQLANDFVSDDTQALIPNGSAANQSDLRNTGINSAVRTQDHPTFETRFAPVNTAPKKNRWLPIKNYLAENKISVGAGLFSLLVLAAIVIWQLQPTPPKYVAVIPPKLTAEGMQESQQELVKGAVYDAIQQSVIQLDGYYLIPRNEIADVNGDNETIRRATAADELITAEIECKVETCKIILTRLLSGINTKDGRLRVAETKPIEVLTENYLLIAEIMQSNIGNMYAKKLLKNTYSINEEEYKNFLEIHHSYLSSGASAFLLEKLESKSINNTTAVQTLYQEISLDLYYETAESLYTKKLENFIGKNKLLDQSSLLNSFYLQIAKKEYENANETIQYIKKINSSMATELDAYLALTSNDYNLAINRYEKLIKLKPSTTNFQNLATAYWYSGDISHAKKYLQEAIVRAPNSYKANQIQGVISLSEGDLSKAIESFSTIIKNNSSVADLSNLGLTFLVSNDLKNAIIYLEKAHSAAPNNLTILLNLADAQNLQGKNKEAIENYKKIINASKGGNISSENLRNRVQAHAHLGEFAEAINSLQLLQKKDGQNIDVIYTASIVYSLAGEKVSALVNIENALNNKMHHIWFGLTWFDNLCGNKKFEILMKQHGAPNRCPST